MKKCFLSLFACFAFLSFIGAQDQRGGISESMLSQIRQSYQGTSTDKAIRNAIGSNDIQKLVINQENISDIDTHFSIKVKSKGITDQKSSGRCLS